MEKYPIDYGMAMHNRGNAYHSLSEIEDKEKNLEKALSDLKDALKVRTAEKYPIDYAITQMSLGIIYMDLSNLYDKDENTKKAKDAFCKALKYISHQDYPIYHNIILHNMKNIEQ